MRLNDNPFFILDVLPTDSVETINEKTEEKEFFDDANEEMYENARLSLTSPVKRLEAELSWVYGRNSSEILELVETNDISSCECSLERLVIGVEYLRKAPTNMIADTIINLDRYYQEVQSNNEIFRVRSKIYVSRSTAGISTKPDREAIVDLLKKKILDVNDAIGQLFARMSDYDIIEVTNEIAARTIEVGENYGQVIDSLIQSYALHLSSRISEVKESVLAEIEEFKNNYSDDKLEYLCKCVSDFDHLVQPIQLFLQKTGQSKSQKESVEVANAIRDLAASLYKTQKHEQATIRLINLGLELFSELPEIYHNLQEDKKILVALDVRKEYFSEVDKSFSNVWTHIKTDVKFAKENQKYLLVNALVLAALLETKENELRECLLETSEAGLAYLKNLAFYYKQLADMVGWGALFKDARKYYEKARLYAQKCDDTELLEEITEQLKFVNDLLKEFGIKIPELGDRQVASKIETVDANNSGFGKIIKVVGIVCVLILGFFMFKNDAKPKDYVNKNSNKVTAQSLAKETLKLKTLENNLDRFKGNKKVVIWDKTASKTIKPNEVIAWKEGDPKGYVVVVDNYDNVKVSEYSSSKSSNRIPGYRKDAKIYVYNLATSKCIGSAMIKGENPPKSYRSKYTPSAIYGDIEPNIVKWVDQHFDLNATSTDKSVTAPAKKVSVGDLLDNTLVEESKTFKKKVHKKIDINGIVYHVVYDGSDDFPLYRFAYVTNSGAIRIIVAFVSGNQMKIIDEYFVSNSGRTNGSISSNTVWTIRKDSLPGDLWKAVYMGKDA